MLNYPQVICPHCNNVYTMHHGGEGVVCPHCNEQQTSSSNRKCPKCGNNMAVYLGANVTCPHCGYVENDLMNRYTAEPIVPFYTPTFTTPDTPLIDDNPNFGFSNTGWICPKCGRGVSPLVSVCPCHHQDVSITCNPLTPSQFN